MRSVGQRRRRRRQGVRAAARIKRDGTLGRAGSVVSRASVATRTRTQRSARARERERDRKRERTSEKQTTAVSSSTRQQRPSPAIQSVSQSVSQPASQQASVCSSSVRPSCRAVVYVRVRALPSRPRTHHCSSSSSVPLHLRREVEWSPAACACVPARSKSNGSGYVTRVGGAVRAPRTRRDVESPRRVDPTTTAADALTVEPLLSSSSSW